MTNTYKVGKVATSIFTEDGWTKVIYHNTCVVKWNDKEIVLNTGGWFTQTTKNRMNQASNQFHLGYRVWQEDGVWFVQWKNGQVQEFIFQNIIGER